MASRVAYIDHERTKRRGDDLTALVAATRETPAAQATADAPAAPTRDPNFEPHPASFYANAIALLAFAIAVPGIIATAHATEGVRAWLVPAWVAMLVVVVALAASEARAMYIEERN